MTRAIILFSILAVDLTAAEALPFRQSGFSADAPGWTVWSDRAETMPRTWVEGLVSLGEPGSLAVSGNGNLGSFGVGNVNCEASKEAPGMSSLCITAQLELPVRIGRF